MGFDRYAFWRDPEQYTATSLLDLPGVIVTTRPEFYLTLHNVTALHVTTISGLVGPDDEILELGCGTGRNLVGLYRAGFRNVRGIEISGRAREVGLAAYPEYADIPVEICPVEEADLGQADLIYTSGLLMHLPDNGITAGLLARIQSAARRFIITVEGETSGHHFLAWGRNYELVFTNENWRQIAWQTCENYAPLPASTIQRVFERCVSP